MPSLINTLLYTLVAATAVVAVPVEGGVENLGDAAQSTPVDDIMARKTPDKCEVHIHKDASNGLCALGNKCTSKWNIVIIDKGSKQIGKTADGAFVGPWYVTNPKGQIKVATTIGKDLLIDGSLKEKNSLTLTYDNQKWNSGRCPGYKYKKPSPSTGHRHEWDLWCEFDC